MSAPVIHEVKEYDVYGAKCPYWDQTSLNYVITTLTAQDVRSHD